MEKQITGKFASCFENDSDFHRTVVLRTPEGAFVAKAVIRQLTFEELLSCIKDGDAAGAKRSYDLDRIVLLGLVSFEQPEGTNNTVDAELVAKLPRTRLFGTETREGIFDRLALEIIRLNEVSEGDAKNF